MKLQVISLNQQGAEIVMKDNGKSTTLHLRRNNRGQLTDRWMQLYNLGTPDLTPAFLAEWYGRRAVDAIYRRHHTADALTRTALRYAVAALPEPEKDAA